MFYFLNLYMSNFIFAQNFVTLWSPLDQFDDMSWTLSNTIYENSRIFGLYTFELEYDVFSLWSRNGNIVSYFAQGSFVSIISIFFLYFYAKKSPYIQEFSIFFLLAFLHLAAVSVLFFWFDDFVSASFSTKAGAFDFGNFPYKGNVELMFLPQINLAFVFDENFITFLAGFFLLGGAEEEEDENFILEEEESDLVEDVVAPLFIANLGKDVEENGALFLKLNTVFAFVLFNNLIGMIPYSDTATSSLILTFWVSLSVFGSLIYLLLRKHGISYFFNLFMPAGAPLALMFLLIPIEFISYTFRLGSLSVRLFANMFAGHTLLKVIVGFSWSMLLIGDIFLLVNILPIAILFVLTFLEIGVAIVQAYIFTTLTAIYLKDIYVSH